MPVYDDWGMRLYSRNNAAIQVWRLYSRENTLLRSNEATLRSAMTRVRIIAERSFAAAPSIFPIL